MTIIIRILALLYRFYTFIEKDPFMQYVYTLFAFSMSIIFILQGLLLNVENYTHISFFSFDVKEYILFSLPIFFGVYHFFYKKKIIILKKIEESNQQPFGYKDLLIIAYLFGSLIFYLISAIKLAGAKYDY